MEAKLLNENLWYPTDKIFVNGKWKVPNQFSGSSKNNWVTRVLDSVSNQIDGAIKKAVKL